MAPRNCSFCGKDITDVRKLIAGPNGIMICDECVMLCVDIVNEDRAPEPHADSVPLATRARGADASSHFLVRVPDGSVHACAQQTEWEPFVHRGRSYTWCVAHGMVRGSTLPGIVAVRVAGEPGPNRGAAYPLKTTLTEDHARHLVDESNHIRGE